ncbi:uncharacterized protein [Diadema setosum]|uniref:uncharacterized protein n=1 Tax=Diadema setosum TaxID=31175 RepID=UPI003B3AF21C
MAKNQGSDIGVEKYLEVFLREVSLDNHPPDHVRISLARTICTELAMRGRWNDVDLLFSTALARDIDSYREVEDILRVEIANEHRKGNSTKVCVLLENGLFRDGKDLIKVWDECQYNLRRAPHLPRTALTKYRMRQKFPPPRSICPAGLREKMSIKSFSRKVLLEFYETNTKYPSTAEKKQLAKTAGLTPTQVHNWFTNMRRKIRNRAGEMRKIPKVESDHSMQDPRSSYETKRGKYTTPSTNVSTYWTSAGSGACSCCVGHMGELGARNKAEEMNKLPNAGTDSDHSMQDPQGSYETKRCMYTSPTTNVSTYWTNAGRGSCSCSIGHMGQLGALSYRALSYKGELIQHQEQQNKEVGSLMKWRKEQVLASSYSSYPEFVGLVNYGSQQVQQDYQPFRPPDGVNMPTEQVSGPQVSSHTDMTYHQNSQANADTTYQDSQATNPLAILQMAAEFVANPVSRQSTAGLQSQYEDRAVAANLPAFGNGY